MGRPGLLVRASRCVLALILGIMMSVGAAGVFSEFEIADSSTKYANPDPSKVLGPRACGECHGSEFEAWSRTGHHKSFTALSNSERAEEIADRLDIFDITVEGSCIRCHFTRQLNPKSLEVDAIAAVSCESCHGAGRDWKDFHSDVGEFPPGFEPMENKTRRLGNAEKHGMRGREELHDFAASCFECHIVADEELVNVGGHKPLSDIELVSWTQGAIRHNFVASEGAKNAPASPERKRVMYVVGRALDLEFALRAVAEATIDESYSRAMEARTREAYANLLKIQDMGIDIPEIAEMLEMVPCVEDGEFKLMLGNAAEYTRAADKIRTCVGKFEKKKDQYRAQLAKLDPEIPTSTRGEPYRP